MTPTVKLEANLGPHKDFATGSFTVALFLLGRGHALLSATVSSRTNKPLFHFREDAISDARLFERERIYLSAEAERAMSARRHYYQETPRHVPADQ